MKRFFFLDLIKFIQHTFDIHLPVGQSLHTFNAKVKLFFAWSQSHFRNNSHRVHCVSIMYTHLIIFIGCDLTSFLTYFSYLSYFLSHYSQKGLLWGNGERVEDFTGILHYYFCWEQSKHLPGVRPLVPTYRSQIIKINLPIEIAWNGINYLGKRWLKAATAARAPFGSCITASMMPFWYIAHPCIYHPDRRGPAHTGLTHVQRLLYHFSWHWCHHQCSPPDCSPHQECWTHPCIYHPDRHNPARTGLTNKAAAKFFKLIKMHKPTYEKSCNVTHQPSQPPWEILAFCTTLQQSSPSNDTPHLSLMHQHQQNHHIPFQ